jgi:HEAT repeat protein
VDNKVGCHKLGRILLVVGGAGSAECESKSQGICSREDPLAAIAMGNSGDKKFLSQLEKLATDSDEAVSESAAWAIRKRSDPE